MWVVYVLTNDGLDCAYLGEGEASADHEHDQ